MRISDWSSDVCSSDLPIGFGHGFGDALGHPCSPLRRPAGVDQQREFVAAQARQLITGLKRTFEPRHYLQYQTVTGLVAKGVVGVAEVIQIQMTERQATAFVFSQARRQQSLEALTIGDAGQRILFGETLQRVFQHATLAHMAQATAPSSPIETHTYPPNADPKPGSTPGRERK